MRQLGEQEQGLWSGTESGQNRGWTEGTETDKNKEKAKRLTLRIRYRREKQRGSSKREGVVGIRRRRHTDSGKDMQKVP
jgi:hypothetical protein